MLLEMQCLDKIGEWGKKGYMLLILILNFRMRNGKIINRHHLLIREVYDIDVMENKGYIKTGHEIEGIR